MFRARLCTLIFALALFGAPAALSAQIGPTPGGGGLPADFRGKVSYFGNHSGEIVTSRLSAAAKPSKDCPRPDQRCPVRIGGSLQVDLEFDGDVVRGSFRGSGGLSDSGLIGRRQGSQCRLFDLADGSVWSGSCTLEGFAGTVKSVPNAPTQISLAFEVVGTKASDYAEQERRRRDALLRARHIDMLRTTIASSAPIETRFAAVIELDSYSWLLDRLVPNSLTGVRKTKPRGGNYEIYGEFQLTGSGTGWARAQVVGDQISCIEFWDFPGQCRPYNQPPAEPDPADEHADRLPIMLKELPLPSRSFIG